MFARLAAEFPLVSARFTEAFSISFMVFVLRLARTGACDTPNKYKEVGLGVPTSVIGGRDLAGVEEYMHRVGGGLARDAQAHQMPHEGVYRHKVASKGQRPVRRDKR